jgi:hypothetical protein
MAKNQAAAALARLRADSLSPERRAEIASIAGSESGKNLSAAERRERASNAAKARWKKKGKRKKS